jgi:two-component system phosphoglycerate transport system response regulator PgtA
MQILIVDDCSYTTKAIARGFNLSGHQAIEASSAEKAYRLFNKNNKSIDAVVCDYYMPAYNGIDLLKKIRLVDGELPFILMSVNMNDVLEEEALNNRCTAVIGKPIDMNNLITLLQKLVDERKGFS